MHIPSNILLAAMLPSTLAVDFTRSSKRGLVFVPSNDYPADNQIWVSSSSDLTWYYNYGVQPSAAFAASPQAEFEFVPQLWTTSDTFLGDIEALVASGQNISHVLTYNEPDGISSTGGAQLAPVDAAKNWISQVEPLRKLGVKTGAPAVTGSPGGFTWLEQFFENCTLQGTNCTADFIPVHWYGDFGGLASHLGQVNGTYPNISQWVTEYAYNDQQLEATQNFFNTSADYFDRIISIDRYSYFGSFRSSVSNVGPNAAMLTENGELTDIGSWYLGGAATSNIPKASSASSHLPAASVCLLVSAATMFFVSQLGHERVVWHREG
ncbi:glycosyl hydrolase catalytic core-domain-containing protein [Calycina marina]|uniref:Glycosyl hydrolase catalytic core-domain-containing protein n=1 Tax=Calycina marina TaxID=1763456 RepID=A0A9P8CHS1_9HELO|nr:glycosyl hydrolase catalytic core-domain-containing protein [Calycina marina]